MNGRRSRFGRRFPERSPPASILVPIVEITWKAAHGLKPTQMNANVERYVREVVLAKLEYDPFLKFV